MNVFAGDSIPQLAHVGWGIALVLILALLWMPAPFAVTCTALFAFLKEFAESEWGIWEPKQPWINGAKDFAFWGVGIAIGAAVLHYRV